jgi:type VI secretion system protein ImpC
MARESSVAPHERISITYRPAGSTSNDETELPLKILVIGDFLGSPDRRTVEDRKPVQVDRETFAEVLREQGIELAFHVPHRLADPLTADPDERLSLKLSLRSLAHFEPQAIVGRVPELKAFVDARAGLTAVKDLFRDRRFLLAVQNTLEHDESIHRVAHLLGLLDDTAVSSDERERLQNGLRALATMMPVGTRDIDPPLVDALIADIDRRLSAQVDAILGAPELRRLEAAWRGLKFLVDRVDFRENIRVEILNLSKADLRADFEDAPEIPKSGLYKVVYSAEYGQFGGKPYGAIIADYEIGPSPYDIQLLTSVAAVAAMSHAPFIAAASPQFFGDETFLGLPAVKDLRSIFEGPRYARWRTFRDSPDARYVGLVLPRFLLRLPYGQSTAPVKVFDYEENVAGHHDRYLWGNAAFAFATRIADSFARYRWCPNIVGPEGGGTVADLLTATHDAMGAAQPKTPTEIAITEHREFELGEEGFIPLTYRKESGGAAFFSAHSCQAPKNFGVSPEAKELELNHRLGTQLPYVFVASRIAHYLKVIQREQIGTWKDRVDLETELNKWIGQYVADMDGVTAAVRARRPLRQAQITVSELEGNMGWHKVDMKIRPHFKYMGAFFTLSLVGKLDKS